MAFAALSIAWLAQVASFAILIPVVGGWAITRLIRGLPVELRVAMTGVAILLWLLAATALLQLFGAGLHPALTWSLPIAIGFGIRRGDVEPVGRRTDLAAWAVAALVFLFLASSAVIGAAERGTDQHLALAAAAEDGSSHYAIYDAIVREGGFYTEASRGHTAQWPYPPGFHVAAASLERAMSGTVGISGPGVEIDAFWLAELFSFAYLVGATATLASLLARAFGASVPGGCVAAAVAGITATFWYPFNLFWTGFLPQILALATLTVLVSVLVSSPRISYRSAVGWAAASIVAISWNWYFLSPVAMMVVLGWLVLTRSRARGAIKFTVVAAAGCIAASVPPIIVGMVSAGSLESVNATGAVASIPGHVVVALCLAVGGWWVARRAVANREERAVLATIALCIAAAATFTLAFRFFQIATSGQASYFYYKSLFTVLVILLPTLSSIAGAALRTRTSLISVALLVIAATVLFDVRPHGRGYADAWRYRDGEVASPLRGLYEAFLDERDGLENRSVVVWDFTENDVVDYYGSRWLSALNGRTTEDFFALTRKTFNDQQISPLVRHLNEHTDETVIVTSDESLPVKLVRAGLSEAGLRGTRFMYLDPRDLQYRGDLKALVESHEIGVA